MLSKLAYTLLLILLSFLGLCALSGGTLLMIKPNGNLLGMQKDWLLDSPFESYFVPGLLLFVFLGVVPTLSCYGLITKKTLSWAESFNLFVNRHWSWSFSLYSGLIALLWIILQQIMTPYFWIQSLILLLGWAIVVLCLLPPMQDRFNRKK